MHDALQRKIGTQDCWLTKMMIEHCEQEERESGGEGRNRDRSQYETKAGIHRQCLMMPETGDLRD